MESLSISHQTLQEFIDTPFGIPNNKDHLKYEDRYQSFKKNNKIKVESSIEFEKNYFIHVKVPSESQKGESYYDVVVQFFTVDKKHETDLNVENYYVQFFSNSPGFVYKYSALYKLQGYLIETLFDKFQPGMLNVLPDKVNPKYELGYDSSIYYACRYLIDNKLFVLGKLRLKIFKSKSVQKFFEDIQDTDSVNISRDTTNFTNKLKKEIKADEKLSTKQELSLKKKSKTLGKELIHKREAQKSKLSTFKNSDEASKIIHSKTNTGGASSIRKISPVKKKTASKSTKKTPK